MSAQILSGLIVGVVVAITGTIVSHLLIMQREARRWDREDKRQRDAWERETQLKHRDDRVALYRNFLADVSIATDEWTAAGPEGLEALLRLRRGYAEIELLGSKEVERAASELFVSAFTLSDLEDKAQEAEEEDSDAAVRHRADVAAKKPAHHKRVQAFVLAVRAELGVDVALPTPRMIITRDDRDVIGEG